MGLKSYFNSVQKELNPPATRENIQKALKTDALKAFLLGEDESEPQKIDKTLRLELEKSKKSQTREIIYSKRSGRGIPRQALGDELSPEVLLMMYRMNPAVRTAIDTITDIVSSTKWDVTPINKKKNITRGLQSEINRIKRFFTYPNFSREPFRRMLRKWTKDLLLYDAGVFEKGRDPDTGKLVEMHVAWGGTISIDADSNGMVNQYFQVIPGASQQLVTWEPKDLMYTMIHPSSDRVYGMSKLETLHNTVTSFLFAEKRNISFFENDARPSGLINLGPGISEHQLDRFRSYWLSENQGTPHKVMVVGGASSETKWVPISVNAKDMDMMNYLNWIFKVIFLVFGIAPSQVGWESGTAAARTPASAAILQSAAFKIRVILPILHELSYAFTEEIIREEFNNDELMFKFQEQPTLQEKLQKATLNRTLLESKQRTVGEIRQEDDLQPYSADQKKDLLTPNYGMPDPNQPGAAASLPPAGGAPGAAPAPAAPGAAPAPAAPQNNVVTKEDLNFVFTQLKEAVEGAIGQDLGMSVPEDSEDLSEEV